MAARLVQMSLLLYIRHVAGRRRDVAAGVCRVPVVRETCSLLLVGAAGIFMSPELTTFFVFCPI